MMITPPHPGELLREDVIDDLGLSVIEATEWLGVSSVFLSHVLNGTAVISSDLALRLEFAGVGTARASGAMQENYDRRATPDEWCT